MTDPNKQTFSPTPTPGRFTQDRNFTLNPIAFLTSDEIEKHCLPKTQTIDVVSKEKIQFPYLLNSNLTEAEQRTLYFDAVIPGCDRFHQTLITVHENFNNPANILTTIITNEERLSETTLTPEEKKHVEKILLPFFIPEYINQIEKLEHVIIGDVLDFYFHAVKKTLGKINSSFYICDEKKYSQEIKNTPIGQLPRTHCSYRRFWKQPEKSNDNALTAENDAIFRFIGTIFGIATHNDDEFKLLVRTLIQSEGMITHRTHLLQAITDYCSTLSDIENNLHFSPQYQSAYDMLSASYPIPDNHQTQIDILKKLKTAQIILQNYIRINTVIHSNETTLNSTDCIVLFKYLTKKELLLFLEKQKQKMIATLRSIHDFQVFFTRCDENELTLLFSILPAELTSLVEHNRSYFDALLKNHATSCEIKCTIIFTLPVELAANLLTHLLNEDQFTFFKLISSPCNYKINIPLRKIQPELLANAIQNIQHFTQIFSLYNNNNEKIFLLTTARILQLINSTSDFCKVFSVLTSEQRKYIYERISNKLPTFVKTIEDFQDIFKYLDGKPADELLSKIRKHLSTIITTSIKLSTFLFSINETQLETTIPFITNTLSTIKNRDDFTRAFFHTSLNPEKLFLIFKYFINMRNRELRLSTGGISYFITNTTSSNIIFLLATAYFTYLNYDGKHKQELDDFLKDILFCSQYQTITPILTKLKEFSGFDNKNRKGRLHNAMKLVITAFEKNKEIDIAELVKITKGSQWTPNCCAAE